MLIRLFFSKVNIVSQKKIAIVTGANSGLRKAFVEGLLQEPIDEIWAIARNEARLLEVQALAPQRIRIFSADLTEPLSLSEFETTLTQEQPCVHYLVNNAGFAKFADYESLNMHESSNLIDLNAKAVVQMALRSIPFMNQGSCIINIGSLSAFLPLPYMNIYAATKVFVKNYSLALREELKPRGIHVTAVRPGWIDTNLYARAEIGAKKSVNTFTGMVKPDVVAQKAIRDAKVNRPLSIYGFLPNAVRILAKFLPASLCMRLWMLQQKF